MQFRKAYFPVAAACLGTALTAWWITTPVEIKPSTSRQDRPGLSTADSFSNLPADRPGPGTPLPRALPETAALAQPGPKPSPHPAEAPFSSKNSAIHAVSGATARSPSPGAKTVPPVRTSRPMGEARVHAAREESDTARNPAQEDTTLPLLVPFSVLDPNAPAGIPAALATASPELPQNSGDQPDPAHLTDEFLNEVAQGSQDPKDPAYQRLWEEAQRLSDSRMKAAYGDAVWLRRHQEAYRQALGNSTPPAPESSPSSPP